jgi:hypothetical protein
MLARYLKEGSPGVWYGRPIIKVTTGTDVAANTETSDAVPAGKLWVILTYAVTLVATVQTPLPRLQVKNAATTSMGIYPGMSAALTAGVTSTLLWGVDLPLTAGAAATSNTGPIPLYGLVLPEGSTIGTNTTGIGANCNYGAPIITAVEYTI